MPDNTKIYIGIRGRIKTREPIIFIISHIDYSRKLLQGTYKTGHYRDIANTIHAYSLEAGVNYAEILLLWLRFFSLTGYFRNEIKSKEWILEWLKLNNGSCIY